MRRRDVTLVFMVIDQDGKITTVSDQQWEPITKAQAQADGDDDFADIATESDEDERRRLRSYCVESAYDFGHKVQETLLKLWGKE